MITKIMALLCICVIVTINAFADRSIRIGDQLAMNPVPPTAMVQAASDSYKPIVCAFSERNPIVLNTECREIRVAGPSCYFGGEIVAAAPGIWITKGKFGTAIVVAINDGILEIHGSDGVATMSGENMTAEELFQALIESRDATGPTIPCGPTEQTCHCTVPAAQTCTGIELNVYRCCPGESFCGCQPSKDAANGCVWALRAVCAAPLPPDPPIVVGQ